MTIRKGQSKNKAVSDWEAVVASVGCIVTASDQINLHHVFGPTARHNKVPIGQFAILPLHHTLHNLLHADGELFDEQCLGQNFDTSYEGQLQLFDQLLSLIDPELHPTAEVLDAIKDYNKGSSKIVSYCR